MNSFPQNHFSETVPIKIPVSLKLHILFAHTYLRVGAVLAIIELIAALLFFPSIETKKSYLIEENDPSVFATITGKRNSGRRHMGKELVIYKFTFKLNNGRTYQGNSGCWNLQAEKGDSVKVLYDKNDPEVCMIKGSKPRISPEFVLPFLFVFLVACFALLAIGFLEGRKNLFLIRKGIFTYGKITQKETLSGQLSKKQIYKIHFEFLSHEGKMQNAFIKSHRYTWSDNENSEPILFDKKYPANAILFNALPKRALKFFLGF
ncbi:MAG: DUF3592 domain-containing protein [Bacteroidia bacterium]|nr:DUF3592 domain-containing protein [Bacteroidia bacterium]